MRMSFDRCGIRCTGRGIVTSAMVWVRKASHSSPSRKIRTPTRSRSLSRKGLAGGVPGVLLRAGQPLGPLGQITLGSGTVEKDASRRGEHRTVAAVNVLVELGTAPIARGPDPVPAIGSIGEKTGELRVCIRGIAHLTALPSSPSARPALRGGETRRPRRRPAPLRDQGQGKQGLIMPGVKINRFVETLLGPLPLCPPPG